MKIHFGGFVPQGWRRDLNVVPAGPAQYQAMKEVARRLEQLGYHSLWLYDHFHTVPDAKFEATFEVWTATAALAEATTRIRLGQMVGCNIYRPPSLLAKITANIDVISNGRLDFGLGAGWYEHETIAYGYPFERPAQRIKELDEALTVIRGMWTQNAFQFDGQYFKIGIGDVHTYRGEAIQLEGAINHPKPVQQPHPPIWIGGGGEQLTLKVVAKHADWSNYGGGVDAIRHKNEVLDKHCASIGRDPASVHRSTNSDVLIGSPEELEPVLRACGRSDEETAHYLKSAASAQEWIDRIGKLRDDARIEAFIAYFPDALKGPSMQRFAEEVMPAL
ncbi:MAG: LLM class flavin-dependent oxidoreductase [Candidatus Xenobia bacterium]